MEAEQADMQSIENRITKLDEKLDTMTLQMATQLATISGQITSRTEIEAGDAKRVSLERFEGEMLGVRDRLAKLEGGSQKALAWIGAGVGCMSAIFTALGVSAAIVIAIVPHLR